MQRLIDAEKLKEYKASGFSDLTEWQQGWNDAIDTIMNEVPTVEAVLVAELTHTVWLTHDVVQVVRCKDCEFSVTPEWDSDEVYCTKHDNWFKINGYCHLGKEKDAN